ncbi:MAG: rod shape-determining protein MreD [Candidatus Omnitrophica bacterium]|nr:rod shape-determining protein MreD [Candidatus Omnitrophota bacterium]
MKKWIIFLVIIILALLQVTFLDYFKVFGARPDLLLISVVIVSFHLGFRRALSSSILAGSLKDIFSANTFGLNILLFPIWSLLLIKLSKKVSIDSDSVRATLIFFIAVFNNIIARMILLFLGNFIPFGVFLRVTLFESLYTACIFPIMSKFIKLAIEQ